MKNCFPAAALKRLLPAFLLFGAGCQRHEERRWQGYFEGEFVYVAAPLAGQLETLAVARGDEVTAGALLFSLEHAAELAIRRQAAERVAAAEARLADLRKGLRPSELAALEARLAQARSAAELARLERERLATLHRTQVIAENDYDRARLAHDQAERLVQELSAQLETAHLGARGDAIAAAEAEVGNALAVRQQAEWAVAQKTRTAAQAARVYDTFFRPGEFVPAGQPVLALLPPENLKVRFFVSEADYAALRPGQTVHVQWTGHAPAEARIVYLSPKPEYTPPVLYNREGRAKLVFMVEAKVEASLASQIHPGQPVEVQPAP